MALTPGARLGPYEILGPLGAGGMGEVFRARDTKLIRDVALKVLPEAFACDPDRLARFTREAQTLAALNHPNIAAVYGIEEGPADAGHVRALVMELVEGETLAERLGTRDWGFADRIRPAAEPRSPNPIIAFLWPKPSGLHGRLPTRSRRRTKKGSSTAI